MLLFVKGEDLYLHSFLQYDKFIVSKARQEEGVESDCFWCFLVYL